jgi:hypothetical protein
MQTYSWIKFIDVRAFILNMITCTQMSNTEAFDSRVSSPWAGYWRLSCSSVMSWCLPESCDLSLKHVPEFTYMVDLWFCINCCICWCMWVIAMIKHGTSNIKFRYYTAHARLCYIRLVQQNVAQRMLGPGKVAIYCLCWRHFYCQIIEHWFRKCLLLTFNLRVSI